MKSAIIAVLAAVAMAAPTVDVRQSSVQACACANAAGQTTTGACIYGWGNTFSLDDGQKYERGLPSPSCKQTLTHLFS